MSMIDVIRKEMMTAMKNKDKERKESLSTLISVVTTLIMRKTTNEEALLAQLEANKKDPKKMKKTGFQEFYDEGEE